MMSVFSRFKPFFSDVFAVLVDGSIRRSLRLSQSVVAERKDVAVGSRRRAAGVRNPGDADNSTP